MKKITIFILCFAVAMTLCSCGTDNSSSDKKDNNSATTIPSISVQGENDSKGTITTATPAPSQSDDNATTTTQPTQNENGSTTSNATTTQPTQNENDAHTHEWGEWYLYKLANPNEKGVDKRYCTTCDAEQSHYFDWQTPSGSYFWNADNYKNATTGNVSFWPRLVYWKNDNLYVDYVLVNGTDVTQTMKGFKELTISYKDPNTGTQIVIAKITNFVFDTPIVIERNTARKDLYLQIGTNDIVTFNSNLDRLSCAWNFDLA